MNRGRWAQLVFFCRTPGYKLTVEMVWGCFTYCSLTRSRTSNYWNRRGSDEEFQTLKWVPAGLARSTADLGIKSESQWPKPPQDIAGLAKWALLVFWQKLEMQSSLKLQQKPSRDGGSWRFIAEHFVGRVEGGTIIQTCSSVSPLPLYNCTTLPGREGSLDPVS